MKKEKSKILKLKKKYNIFLWLKKHFFKIVLSLTILLTAGLGASLFTSFVPLALQIIGSGLCVSSLGVAVHHKAFENFFDIIRAEIDDEIEKLIASDNDEKQILNEYNIVSNLKKDSNLEIKARKRLIKSIIERKNQEAKEQNKLIKELTKKKQAEAEQEVIKELEQQETQKYKDFDIRDFRDDL